MPMEILPFNPPSERYTIKIRILGLRNLKSSGLLSVQKAVLKFDVGSLNPIGLLKENQDYLIVSSPESGPDPNICTILKFEADLPKNYSLCPSLTCLVLDTVWEGILQPVLGSFAIDLGNIMANNKELMKKLCPKQNEFIMNHPLMHLGETNDPFIMEIEGEEMNLITEKYKKDKDKVLREENSIIADDYLKSIQKYPEVLNEKGELKPEYMVIKPKYTRTPKKQFMTEDTIPDPEHYIGLGHDKREDKLKNQTNKHYRYYINTELEKSGFMNQNLFSQFPIFKGKRFVEEDFLDFFSMDQRLEEVGLFKGWVEVYQEKLGEDKLKTMKTEEVRKGEEIDALILKEEEFLVRVYVIDVLNLQQMDDDSLSDPYVRIVLGSRTIDVNIIITMLVIYS